MTLRHLVLSIATGSLAMACGPAEAPPPGTLAAKFPPVSSGRYDVRGITTVRGSTDKRKLAGTVILVQQGDRYTATFELKTKYPSDGVPTDADVIGVGEGTIEGAKLQGSAKTQLVISTVPGVDTGFAFVPRQVTARIVSDSIATLKPDGSISIQLDNRPAEGQQYVPTRTRLTGRRSEAHDPAVAKLE
jgi:hypothetical protein